MRSFRSKPVGWKEDTYRHYLAAKYGSAGAKRTYKYTPKTGLGRFVAGAFQEKDYYDKYGDLARAQRIAQEQSLLQKRLEAEKLAARSELTPSEELAKDVVLAELRKGSGGRSTYEERAEEAYQKRMLIKQQEEAIARQKRDEEERIKKEKRPIVEAEFVDLPKFETPQRANVGYTAEMQVDLNKKKGMRSSKGKNVIINPYANLQTNLNERKGKKWKYS